MSTPPTRLEPTGAPPAALDRAVEAAVDPDPGAEPETADSVLGRIASSGAWSMVGHATTAASAFAVGILVARTLGPEPFGRYSLFVWVLRLLPVLLAVGVPLAYQRLVAEHLGADRPGPAIALFRSGLRFHLVVLPVPVAATAWIVWQQEGHLLLAATMALGVAIGLTALDFEGLLQALRRFRTLGLITTVTATGQLVVAVAGAVAGVGWQTYVALHAATLAAGGLAAALVTRPTIAAQRDARASRDDRRRFARFSGMMALLVVLDSVVWGRPELFFLSIFRSDSDVGLYAAGARLASIAVVVPLMAARALVPEFSYLRGGGHEDTLRAVYPRVCRLLAILSAPLALGGAAVAGPLVVAVYGSGFSGATSATAVLLVGSFVNALAGPATAAVLTGHRPRLVAEVGIVTVVLNVGLAALLVPAHGPLAAAAVNVSVQALAVGIGIGYAWARLGLRYPVREVAGILVLGAASALAAWLAHGVVEQAAGEWIGLAVGISVGAATYVAALAATGTLTFAELRVLRGAPAPAEPVAA